MYIINGNIHIYKTEEKSIRPYSRQLNTTATTYQQ